MDIAKVIAELRQERSRIEEAITSLEHLAMGKRRGRGRPPAWMAEAAAKCRRRPIGRQSKPSVTAIASPWPGDEQRVAKATEAASLGRGFRLAPPLPPS